MSQRGGAAEVKSPKYLHQFRISYYVNSELRYEHFLFSVVTTSKAAYNWPGLDVITQIFKDMGETTPPTGLDLFGRHIKVDSSGETSSEDILIYLYSKSYGVGFNYTLIGSSTTKYPPTGSISIADYVCPQIN